MKIVIAKNIGFCTGVRRALEIAKNSLKIDPKPVQFLGEIIHNEKIVNGIKEKGGKFISDPREAKSGTLIIRAHGSSPFPLLKNVSVRDATCPLVKRAQESAKKLAKEGYEVVIIGEKKHPEVEGIRGNIKNKAIVIENETEARKIKWFKKLGVISQTTQGIDKTERILKILKNKSAELKWINTLCPQVLLRQKNLLEIIKKVDGILVIGSKTSANTQRLARIAKKSKKPVWRINSLEELKKLKLKNSLKLGVVSGTSAPDWIVKEIKNYLEEL